MEQVGGVPHDDLEASVRDAEAVGEVEVLQEEHPGGRGRRHAPERCHRRAWLAVGRRGFEVDRGEVRAA